MPEGRLERTRKAYTVPVVGSYEWAIECERVRLREQEYRSAASVYFADLSRWYAARVQFTTDRDTGDETTT